MRQCWMHDLQIMRRSHAALLCAVKVLIERPRYDRDQLTIILIRTGTSDDVCAAAGTGRLLRA